MQRLPRPGIRFVPEIRKHLDKPFRRYEVSSEGSVCIVGSDRPLQGRFIRATYKVVLSPDDESGKREFSVAELVAQHFMDPPPKGFHMLQRINGGVECYATYNLRWVTPEEFYCRPPTEPGSWRRLVEPLQYYSVSDDVRIWSHRTHALLTPYDSKIPGSYLTVGLTEFARGAEKATRERTHRVHRLVAMAWVEKDNDEQHPIVNHKDRDRRNNHYTNLEWCTQAHNVQESAKARKEAGTLVVGRNICKRVVQWTPDGAELAWNSAKDAAMHYAASSSLSVSTLQGYIGQACRSADGRVVPGTGASWRFETPKEIVPPDGAKPIPDYSGYWATTEGRKGGIWSSWSGRLLTPQSGNTGYGVVLVAKDSDTSEGRKKFRPVLVHRLVALAFDGPVPADKMVVNHKSGIRDENRPGNLEYLTQSENVKDGWERRKQRIDAQWTVGSVARRLKLKRKDVRQLGAHFVTRGGRVWSAFTKEWMDGLQPKERRRMVCSAWKGPRGSDYEVVYGDPTNYAAKNLRWEKASEARSLNTKTGKERCKRKREAAELVATDEETPSAKRQCLRR